MFCTDNIFLSKVTSRRVHLSDTLLLVEIQKDLVYARDCARSFALRNAIVFTYGALLRLIKECRPSRQNEHLCSVSFYFRMAKLFTRSEVLVMLEDSEWEKSDDDSEAGDEEVYMSGKPSGSYSK